MVLELMKARHNQGLDPNLFFYRDSQGREVDLIYQRGRELIPIEIKSSQTYNSSFLDTLRMFHSLVGERAPKSFLLYGGEEGQVHSTTLLSWREAAQIILP